MSYQALYRTYRPKQFCEVVGQEHITTILKNQVQSGHNAHAYLFCGTRGTGKTSTARILARALNCLQPVDGEPCGTCANCLQTQHEHVDLIEIDAASNNGVDDMRALLEKAHFTPLYLKIKVYMIDEAHMLSMSAFNALLKTLEEPPEHVVFILATTEPQKLPATILSRCQRFDFHRISVADMVANLKSVLKKTQKEVEEAGLLAIARSANGGMRDALSLLDQCLSFCGDRVSAQDVYDVLGCVEQDVLFRITDAVLDAEPGQALSLLDGIVTDGRDLGVFLTSLIQHMRMVLLAKSCDNAASMLNCTKETMVHYEQQAAHASEAWLLHVLQVLMQTQGEMRWTRTPRVLLETILIRLCRPEDTQSILALEERVARLEKRLEELDSGAHRVSAPPEEEKLESRPASTGDDAPPWEEAVPARAPEAHKSASTPKPAPEPAAPASTDDADGAQGLWTSFKAALQKRNVSLYILAKDAAPRVVGNNVFCLRFSPTQKAQVAALNAPRNFAVLTTLLKELQPNLQVRIEVEEPEDEATKNAVRIFGERLIIEE